MSIPAADNFSNLGAQAGIPSLNIADVPANIRTGDKRARQAYVEGLAFEQVLVNQLTRQMATTLSGSTSPDGSATGGSGSGGLSGAAAAFSSLIPQALTQGIMAGGGLGIAEEFAASVDPALTMPSSGQSTPGSSASQSAANRSGQVKA